MKNEGVGVGDDQRDPAVFVTDFNIRRPRVGKLPFN